MHTVPSDILQPNDGLDLTKNADQQQQPQSYQHIPQTVLNHQQQQPQQSNIYSSHQQQQPTTVIKKEMIDALYSDVESVQLEATQKFRKLLSRDPHPPIEEVIQKGIVPRFVQFLKNNNNASLQVRYNLMFNLSFTTLFVCFHYDSIQKNLYKYLWVFH